MGFNSVFKRLNAFGRSDFDYQLRTVRIIEIDVWLLNFTYFHSRRLGKILVSRLGFEPVTPEVLLTRQRRRGIDIADVESFK